MLGFLLFILLLVVLWPLLKIGWQLWSNVRKVKQFMADPAEFYRRQEAGSRRQAYSQPQPRPRHKSKKISRDTGEYIAFEDIEVSAGQSAAGNDIEFKTESQITDIEWEDIK